MAIAYPFNARLVQNDSSIARKRKTRREFSKNDCENIPDRSFKPFWQKT
jgi:hypothetical protein